MAEEHPLVEPIYQEISKDAAARIAPAAVVKSTIAHMVTRLEAAGWRIEPPGAPVAAGAAEVVAAPAATAMREQVPLTASSFFCPHCGKHQPPYGFNSSTGELPGLGKITFLTLFCGVPSCRRILQVIIAGIEPGGDRVQ
jgi:hypothetical protein